MSVSASRSAFTCARCRSLQRLRANTLAPASLYAPLSTSRPYSSTATTQSPPPPAQSSGGDEKQYFFKSYGPKIVGRKGRRQRADAERLKIKSLDKESDIIVLRDIAEEPSPPKPITISAPDEELDPDLRPKTQTVDIENLLVSGATPEQSELFAAIEQHIPTNAIVSRNTWEAKRDALVDAHTQSQLNQYLRRWRNLEQSRPAESATNEDTVIPPQAEVGGASAAFEVKNVVVSEWTGSRLLSSSAQSTSTAASEKNLASQKETESISKQVSQLGKVESAKIQTIHQIMRDIWKLRIDEESVSTGEIEVKLTATQWTLLQTRLAHDLFNLLRQPALFWEVRLERDPISNSLWIRGPRIRCEALVEQIKKTFESVVVQSISLKDLETILPTTIPKTLDKFTPKLIRDIEQSTNVHISVDRKSSTISISGFESASNSTALRLVTMMFGISPPVSDHVNKYNRYYRGMIIPDTSSIPVGLQSMSLRRSLFETVKYPRIKNYNKPKVKGDLHTFPVQLIGHLTDKKMHTIQIHGHLNAADKLLKRQVTNLRPPLPADSMWTIPTETPKWRFDFGSYLGEVVTFSNVYDNEPVLKTATQRRRYDARSEETHNFFRGSPPKLLTFCSWFDKVPDDHKDATVGNRVVAKFIPSPYPEKEAVANFQCPPIELIFTITHQTQPEMNGEPYPDDQQQGRHSWPIPRGRQLTLTEVNAAVKQERQVCCFPLKSVDLRMSRKLNATADLDRMMENEQFRSCVRKIVETLQREEDKLWEPPSLTLTVPKRFPPDYPPGLLPGKKKLRAKRVKEIAREEEEYDKIPPERATPYFFAGFETRQTRQMYPEALPDVIKDESDIWTITDSKGGMNAGSQLNLCVQNGPQSKDLMGLLQRTLWTINLMTYMDQGFVGPLVRRREHDGAKEGRQDTQSEPKETTEMAPAESDPSL